MIDEKALEAACVAFLTKFGDPAAEPLDYVNEVRAAITAYEAAKSAEPVVTVKPLERYQHKKRGSIYTVLHRGRLQVDADLDNEKVVIYQSEDGQVWVRPEYEFNDGRFVPLPQDTTSVVSHETVDLRDKPTPDLIERVARAWNAIDPFYDPSEIKNESENIYAPKAPVMTDASVEYEIVIDDEFQVGANTLEEITRYAAIYSQDDDVEIWKVTRENITTALNGAKP